MSPLLIVIVVLAALALVTALFVVGNYNKLVALRNRFKNAYAQIDVQLKDKLIEHKQHIDKYGEDTPEIRNWKWGNPK